MDDTHRDLDPRSPTVSPPPPIMLSLLFALCASPVSLANESPIEPHELKWEIRAGGAVIGTRKATVKYQPSGGDVSRIVESWTDIRGRVGPVDVDFQQRLTMFATNGPSSFHAVIDEDSIPREVQARRSSGGWTVSVADEKRVRTWTAPDHQIDLSTADLFDPLTRVPISGLENARVLSAETGDLWEGTVEDLGSDKVTVDGTRIPVTGVAWNSPEGRNEFWFSSEGFLVRYQVRVLGFVVDGTLIDPPPRGADEFPVNYRWLPDDGEDL
jgi:hypothetical protein